MCISNEKYDETDYTAIFLEVLIMGHFMSFVCFFLVYFHVICVFQDYAFFCALLQKSRVFKIIFLIKIYILHFDANTNGIMIAIAGL